MTVASQSNARKHDSILQQIVRWAVVATNRNGTAIITAVVELTYDYIKNRLNRFTNVYLRSVFKNHCF